MARLYVSVEESFCTIEISVCQVDFARHSLKMRCSCSRPTYYCVLLCRLGWPDLLDHPFVRETCEERLKREKALADAVELADCSRAWKVGVS
jgi:hypothetical protein